MWEKYFIASSIDEVLDLLSTYQEKARIIAGGTDLILEIERGVKKNIEVLIDISRLQGLESITLDPQGWIHLGPLTTHNHCVESSIIRKRALPLALATWEVGAPQIRNLGTIAGNVITASPANDSITPLMALDATVTLQSKNGQRDIRLANYYPAFRKTVMEPDEMLVDIKFSSLSEYYAGSYIKIGLRKAQAISVVHCAIVLEFTHPVEGEVAIDENKIQSARIALGSVTPVITRAHVAESYLIGKTLKDEVVDTVANFSLESASPIDDIRGSANYRNEMVRVAVRRAILSIKDNSVKSRIPEKPVLLWGKNRGVVASPPKKSYQVGDPIECKINGRHISIPASEPKSLLRWLREDVGLTGTKEGCAEGECGACTVFLDGKAVMSCLVPAPRAHGAEIVTIEGLESGDSLHPVQSAFIEEGAVQCGYCIPGFIMSGAKLLEEKPHPSQEEIKMAITGNLCRCTGYYKIVKAIEKAACENKMESVQ